MKSQVTFVIVATVYISSSANVCRAWLLPWGRTSRLYISSSHQRSRRSLYYTPYKRSCRPSVTSLPSNEQQGDEDSIRRHKKEELLQSLRTLQQLRDEREANQTGTVDGFDVDFGVKGGELNETSRAPRTVDYYSLGNDIGQAADNVVRVCQELSAVSAITEPTANLGVAQPTHPCPLDGVWRLLFTNSADAVFTKNSKRGPASTYVVIEGEKGKITNIIDFAAAAEESKSPPQALSRLEVVLRADTDDENPRRVNLQFRYVKALLTRLFFLPLFGRTVPLYIPVPGPFITRIIVTISRLIRWILRRKSPPPTIPKAYFDVLYLDNQLRIQETAQGNLFVQAKDDWKEATPLFQ